MEEQNLENGTVGAEGAAEAVESQAAEAAQNEAVADEAQAEAAANTEENQPQE